SSVGGNAPRICGEIPDGARASAAQPRGFLPLRPLGAERVGVRWGPTGRTKALPTSRSPSLSRRVPSLSPVGGGEGEKGWRRRRTSPFLVGFLLLCRPFHPIPLGHGHVPPRSAA